MAISEYPKILTDKDWQDKKGKIAKLAGKTGIGELMKKAEEAHKKIDWTAKYDLALRLRLQLDKFDLTTSKDEIIDILEKQAITEFMVDAAPVRKALSELRDQAKKIAGEWKKKPLVPSSSAKHAEEVAKQADLMFLSMKESSEGVASLFGAKKVRELLQKKKLEALQQLDKQIELCENGLKACLKTATKKCWVSGGAHQGCRSVNNSVAAIPALKKIYYPTWNKFGNNYADDIPDNDPEEAKKIKEKVKTVFNELIKFKAGVHKMLNG